MNLTNPDKIAALQLLRTETIRAAEAGELTGLCGRINGKLNLDKRLPLRIKNALNFWVIATLNTSTEALCSKTAFYWPKGALEPRIKWIDNQIKLLQNGSEL